MTQSAWLDVIDHALQDAAAVRAAIAEHLMPEDAAAWDAGALTSNVEGLQRALSQRFRGRWPGTFHLNTDEAGRLQVHLIGLTDADVAGARRDLRRARHTASSGPFGRVLRLIDTLLP